MSSRVILVTGATGFVGRQVLAALESADVRIKLVVRKKRLDSFSNKVDLIETDDLFVESASWWESVCAGVDTIIHVAWYAEPGKYLQSSINLTCLQGTINMVQGAAQAGVRRFVGVGTCFEYDLTGGVLSVQTPLNPLTLYAATKVSAYHTLSNYFSSSHVEFAWCRLFYLYGEGEDTRRLVPYIRERLQHDEEVELTSGKQIRDFLDVEEAGKMISQVALGSVQGPVNICSGEPISVRQLAENIADEYGKRSLLRFGVREDNIVDPPCVVGVKTELLD